MKYIDDKKRIRQFWDQQANYNARCSVLDPNDQLGKKNLYIRKVIASAYTQLLSDLPANARILDFGCGTGQNFNLLHSFGLQPFGVDISYPLLFQAKQLDEKKKTPVFLYDGANLPVRDCYFDAVISYVVLNYLVNTDDFSQVLSEIWRSLKPGGVFAAIEQTTPSLRFKNERLKLQRPIFEFIHLFREAGFELTESKILRRGHFPLIYFIRYGLIPSFMFSTIVKLESLLGNYFKKQFFDYAEVIFVLRKPAE